MEPLEDRRVPATLSVAAGANLIEGGPPATAYVVTRDDTTGSLSVNFTFSGTATGGSDYFLPPSVSFSHGQATVNVILGPTNDSTSEPTETITFTIDPGSYTIGSPSSATVNILDNDAQYVSVAKLSDAEEMEDGDDGVFRLTRIGDLSGSLTVNFSVGGTATSGTDFTSVGTSVVFAASSATADVTVVASQDNLVEGGETVSLTVTSGTGYTVGSPSSDSLTIADDPPVVAVTAADTVEGGATGGFSFTRTGGNLASSLTVNYTVGGTATSGTDYTSIGTSVVFAAGQDRVELGVEAFGDNTADDAETVVLTISTSSNYTIDSGADDATVTIHDQPLTVSVTWLSDGTEGGGNGTFRFTRYGDLSEELVVTYTVGGTATAGGTDYTSLSGTVTFDEEEDTVDVTVTVNNDGTGEGTETVTVTIDEAEEGEYLLGNDSDTVLIRDNDARTVYWTNEGLDGLWGNSANWRTAAGDHVVPDEYDEVYFSGGSTTYYSNDDCFDLGDGEEGLTFRGIHFVNGYDGIVILAAPLTVGTFEMLTGTLDQPDDDFDLTVNGVLLWSGGTLNATDSGAVVEVTGSGTVGRIDPPDVGSMAIASTLNVVSGALVTIVGGTLEFIGGEGMYINAKVDFVKGGNIDPKVTQPVTANRQIEIGSGGKLEIKQVKPIMTIAYTELPILNAGILAIGRDIHFVVQGHVGGANYPSIVQTGGAIRLATTSTIEAKFGMSVIGGDLSIRVQGHGTTATIQGDLIFAGNQIELRGLQLGGDDTLIEAFGNLRVEGNVIWTSGTYKPQVHTSNTAVASVWTATGTFTIGENAVISPFFFGLTTEAEPNEVWKILVGEKGIDGATEGCLAAGLQNDWDILEATTAQKKTWFLRKK